MCVLAFRVFLAILLCAPRQCLECPFGCECSVAARAVKCVSADLRGVPPGVPGYARTVTITGDHIHQIGPDSLAELTNVTDLRLSNNRIAALDSRGFSALPNLRFLDLSGNRLALIHPEALSIPASPLRDLNLSRSLYNSTSLADLATALRWGGLRGLLRLDLSGNRLALLPPGMFSHLPGLQQLFLANNSLAVIHGGTFSGVNQLQMLDLTGNAFTTFRTDALRELDGLGNVQIHLGENPYACSCQIRNFVAWLNESRAQVDLEALRCASPKELSDTQLWGISALAIGCAVPAEADHLALQTSYVFLGLVLGFVGMVFLFVLYLNRHGMKKWITDMRDACRDVMEGYHYRFEIDSDPRLGHVSERNAGGGGTRRNPGGAPPQQLPSDTCITRAPSSTHVKELTTSPPVMF